MHLEISNSNVIPLLVDSVFDVALIDFCSFVLFLDSESLKKTFYWNVGAFSWLLVFDYSWRFFTREWWSSWNFSVRSQWIPPRVWDWKDQLPIWFSSKCSWRSNSAGWPERRRNSVSAVDWLLTVQMERMDDGTELTGWQKTLRGMDWRPRSLRTLHSSHCSRPWPLPSCSVQVGSCSYCSYIWQNAESPRSINWI